MCGSRFGFHGIWLCRLQTLHSKLKRYIDDIVYQLDNLNFLFNEMTQLSCIFEGKKNLTIRMGHLQILESFAYGSSWFFRQLGACMRVGLDRQAGPYLLFLSE